MNFEELEALRCEVPDGLFISAHNPEDVAFLRKKILQYFESNMIETTMLIPYDKGRFLGQLRTKASIINETHDETGTEVTFKTFPETVTWLQNKMDETDGNFSRNGISKMEILK